MEIFLILFLVIIIKVFPVIVPIGIPVGMLIFGYVKHKRKLLIVASVLTVIAVLLEIMFFVLFPTRFPYCDSWIVGKTKDEIVTKYGEPDFNGYRIGYNVGYGTIGLDAPNVDYYYYVEFDENGYADEIYIASQPGG